MDKTSHTACAGQRPHILTVDDIDESRLQCTQVVRGGVVLYNYDWSVEFYVDSELLLKVEAPCDTVSIDLLHEAVDGQSSTASNRTIYAFLHHKSSGPPTERPLLVCAAQSQASVTRAVLDYSLALSLTHRTSVLANKVECNDCTGCPMDEQVLIVYMIRHGEPPILCQRFTTSSLSCSSVSRDAALSQVTASIFKARV